MHTLFEEAGKFLAGRILSETDASLQVELDSGKRVKVKAANALLKFEKPAPAELMARGQLLSLEIDLDLAWEFASDEEFSFADLARDYFSADPSQAASLPSAMPRPSPTARPSTRLAPSPPENPDHVFAGLTRGISLGPPRARPAK